MVKEKKRKNQSPYRIQLCTYVTHTISIISRRTMETKQGETQALKHEDSWYTERLPSVWLRMTRFVGKGVFSINQSVFETLGQRIPMDVTLSSFACRRASRCQINNSLSFAISAFLVRQRCLLTLAVNWRYMYTLNFVIFISWSQKNHIFCANGDFTFKVPLTPNFFLVFSGWSRI